MGLFSRKVTKAEVLTEMKNPFGIGTVTVNESGNIVGEVWFGSIMLDDDADTEVVGESFYRDTLLSLIDDAESDDEDGRPGRVRQGFELDPEPSNPHDRNAVRVMAFGETVGYLPRDLAARMSPILLDLRRGGATEFNCEGVILWPAHRGDPAEDPSIPVGVRLDLFDDFT